MAASDRAVFDAIEDLLRGTGHFDRIVRCLPEDLDAAVAADGSVAVLTPVKATVTPTTTPSRRLRVVDYALTAKVRESDPEAASDWLDRIAGSIHDALEGQGGDYADFVLPERSQVGRETYDATDRPNYLLGMMGQFAYVVDDEVGYSTEA